MVWAQRFTCDVCGKRKGDSEHWWLAVNECGASIGEAASQPILKLFPWDNMGAHSAESKHLCGAVCSHTYLDRWMAEFNAGDDDCGCVDPA